MVGRVDYSSVPTSADLEHNSKKYTVNKSSGNGIYLPKYACALLVLAAMLLAAAAALLVYFLVPPKDCLGVNGVEPPGSLTQKDRLLVASARDQVEERLPRSIEPKHYRLQIIPYLENSTTAGVVEIALVPTEDTNKIVLHSNELDINKESVSLVATRPNATAINIADQGYLEGQRYFIEIVQVLQKGQEYRLSIKFYGKLSHHLQGFYRSQYVDLTQTVRYAASTQFSPTDARRAFPCFDEPSFKARFTISIARPGNMSTLSNMPLAKSDPFVGQQDWYWDHYPETPRMPTYLVAFMVSDLRYGQIKDPMIKVWTRLTMLTQTEYASAIAPSILRYFEGYFGVKFPLPKIDIVAVPEFGFNAMENWGLITFRESSLLYDPRTSTNEDLRTIATILSHEIAHQWFGNLVTPKWWNDLWLKEGFATYLEYLGVDHAEPKWKIPEEFMISETDRAMAADALGSSRPISSEVVNSGQIREAFNDISYAKGACIIRMMNHFLGEGTFKRGLINVLKKYEYDNADRQDLFAALTEEAHRDGVLQPNESVKEIMDTWTEQAGFPVITAIADYENSSLHISQKRFLLTESAGEKSHWWVPISFTTDAERNFQDTRPRIWLKGEPEITTNVQFGRYWYILNINQTGYYIVNYDERNWRSLSEHIMSVSPLVRAQLISDSMDLARANLLDYDVPLKMIAKMAVQDQKIMFVPTYVAFSKLRFLSDILPATPAYGLFEEYHSTVFSLTYQKVDFGDEIDDYLTRRIRKTVLEWACRSSDSRCTHESRAAFRRMMMNEDIVLPNLREIVYCTAIREGGVQEWEAAYRLYETSQSVSEKNILLEALGCTRIQWLLSRYVDILIRQNSSIRIQDADKVFESVAKNRFGIQIAFDFIRNNWNELLEHYGEGFNILGKMIKSLAPYMNTEYQLSEFERFREDVKSNISVVENAFDTAIEIVKANVQWMDKNYKHVADWLKQYKDHYARRRK